ncbi:MAG: hypothetical protein M1404_04160 [Acidobacteria bacterium]|nr:hypothetical protein [Acidobacteriota bacterium]
MSLSVVVLSTGFVYAGQRSRQKAEINRRALGSTPCAWSPPLVNANGAVDPEATIRILKANGLGCFGALIWRQHKGGAPVFAWASFTAFVAAAQTAGIDVWAILIPPSEGGNSPPFNRDYLRWMQELAKLSLKYPRLKGVNIDDFYWDYKFFTPQYTCQIYSAKQKINPRLQFAPTIYGLDTDFADRYGGCVDGVWLWWRNLEGNVGLDAWLKNSRLAEKDRFPIYGGVYAGTTHWHKGGRPEPRVFRSALETTCRYANGAVIWQMALTPPNPLLDVARSFGFKGSSPLAGRCGTLVDKSRHSTTN